MFAQGAQNLKQSAMRCTALVVIAWFVHVQVGETEAAAVQIDATGMLANRIHLMTHQKSHSQCNQSSNAPLGEGGGCLVINLIALGWLQMAKREGTVHMSVLQQGNNRRKLHPAWPPRTGVGREWKAPGRAPDKALKRTETAIHVCTSPVGTAPPGSKCASQCLPALPRWVCSLKVWPMALGVGSINRQASGANAAAVRL